MREQRVGLVHAGIDDAGSRTVGGSRGRALAEILCPISLICGSLEREERCLGPRLPEFREVVQDIQCPRQLMAAGEGEDHCPVRER
jgi:hypothetical protein